VSDGLPDIIYELEESPTARDIAHLAVTAFSDGVQDVLPLTPMRDQQIIPALPKGQYTNYGSIFSWLADAVPRDHERLMRTHNPKCPTIYFLTDGHAVVNGRMQPDSEWVPALTRLRDAACRPIIVSLGFGDAKTDALCRIATAEGGAWIAEGVQPPSVLLRSILRNIVMSVVRSASSSHFMFAAPDGMRRLGCPT
jgi:uncharacterized protein YegL